MRLRHAVLHVYLEGFTCRIPEEFRSDLRLRSLIPRLRTLNISAMKSDGDDLASLICTSGALSTLILHDSSDISSEGKWSSALSVDGSLECNADTFIWDPYVGLRANPNLDMLTRWFEGGKRCIQRLATTEIGSEGTPHWLVQKLLDASGDSLEHLFLHFPGVHSRVDYDELVSIPNLDNNTRLKTLHIAFHHCRPDVTNILYTPSARNAFGNLTLMVIRVMAYDMCPDIESQDLWIGRCDLCLIHPLLNLVFCFQFTVIQPPIAGAPRETAIPSGADRTRQKVIRFVQLLPTLHRTGGRVRFGIVWQTPHSGSFFKKGLDGEHHLPDYFLGDPEWYHPVQAPWDRLY
ncbi:uncharacterized protein B0H18DRAFT_1122298 [Fomitopsis serialis]|uniref:uncharacterized protein n=1 Tax=Fomitopsis serialis TaxID=139415 RepID=UPI0020083096|nr:uncharacterized protein B0H18DRAFT_1122298 [Neoantrodia serialis]KAH9919860.1 hypothetical protein B0H18DRAFT_1122298 [Neoantrodia serialis]